MELSKKIRKNTIEKYKGNLKDYSKSDIVKKCSHCSFCREICPIYRSFNFESNYPGGKLRVFRTFVQEKYPISKEFVKTMMLCTTCKRCEEICPISLNFVELIEEIRKTIVSTTNLAYENQNLFAKYIYNYKNPYGEKLEERGFWIPKDFRLNNKSPYGYFVGCTSSYREQNSARNTALILNKCLKEGIQILDTEEYCCCSPLIRTGQVEFDLNSETQKTKIEKKFDVKDLIVHNINLIKEKGIKYLIFNCAGCFKTVSKDWPKFYNQPLPFKCFHLTQFISEKIDKKEIKFKQLNKKVTYHDPCHLGRHMGIYNEPRKILKAIPSLTLIEMENNRENAICCGAGGGFKAGFPNEAVEVAKMRLKEAYETGAELLVTSCIFCKRNLSDAINTSKYKLEVLNIEDLIINLLE